MARHLGRLDLIVEPHARWNPSRMADVTENCTDDDCRQWQESFPIIADNQPGIQYFKYFIWLYDRYRPKLAFKGRSARLKLFCPIQELSWKGLQRQLKVTYPLTEWNYQIFKKWYYWPPLGRSSQLQDLDWYTKRKLWVQLISQLCFDSLFDSVFAWWWENLLMLFIVSFLADLLDSPSTAGSSLLMNAVVICKGPKLASFHRQTVKQIDWMAPGEYWWLRGNLTRHFCPMCTIPPQEQFFKVVQ
jgi:hypothetical protein